VAQAQRYVAEGYNVVVDLDLEKFLDRVNHDCLMARVAARIPDKRVLKLIRAFLNVGVMEDGLVLPVDEGTPQGGPLSPLLSNLILNDLDKELTRRGHLFCRYADDCNIYVRSQRAGERVMASVGRFLTTKLRFKVNEAKSAVARPEERKFLGFSISNEGSERRISPKALDKFKMRVRDQTRPCRTRGCSLSRIIEELTPYLVGWRAYFGFCQTPQALTNLEAWIRRRLRSYLWRQWGNGPNRFKELRRRGVTKFRAAVAAGSPTGFWRMSGHRAVQAALRNHHFDSLDLPRLYVPVSACLTRSNRRGTRSVCPVVWEGRRCEAPPYPDQSAICGALHMAEVERELISERTRAGLATARAGGRKGGRKPKMTPAKVRLAAAAMGKNGTIVNDLCEELGINRSTMYRYVSPTGGLRRDGRKVVGGQRVDPIFTGRSRSLPTARDFLAGLCLASTIT
jgi:RNA-directed DNA polymerase